MKELARLLSGITVRGKTQVLNVGEIVWEFRDDVTMVGTGVEFGTDPDSAPVPTLRLRHSTGELVLVDGSEIKLGRSADCDILIVDPKASRMHASIERRRDKFVLIDRSANGTYVVLDDKREIHLKREEFTLSGGGVLGFGQSPRAPGADTRHLYLRVGPTRRQPQILLNTGPIAPQARLRSESKMPGSWRAAS